MVKIKVTPESLQNASQRIHQKIGEFQTLKDHLFRTYERISWEVRQKAGIENELTQLRSRAADLSEWMDRLCVDLEQSAAAFREADEKGYTSLANLPMSGGAEGWLQMTLDPELLKDYLSHFPEEISSWLTSTIQPIHAFLLTASVGILPSVQDGGPLDGQQFSSANSTTQTTGFGDLLAQDFPPPTPFGVQYDVPYESQHNLTYQGIKTNYGCVPTSAGMILDYWNNLDGSNTTLDPQQLLNMNAAEGEFNSTGMLLNNLSDEFSQYGYQSEFQLNATEDDLLLALSEGPVIAQVNLNMRRGGADHAVVITGIDKVEGRVYINDPWNSKNQTYSWEEFSASWENDHGDYQNIFLSIRPD